MHSRLIACLRDYGLMNVMITFDIYDVVFSHIQSLEAVKCPDRLTLCGKPSYFLLPIVFSIAELANFHLDI